MTETNGALLQPSQVEPAGASKGRRARFTLCFDDLQSVHLFKDVGQIPFQMQRHFGFDAEIVCRRNEERYLYLDDVLKGLRLSFHGGHPFRFLLREARDIDVLMLFHISTRTIYRGLLYKFLNPRGYLYIKADMTGGEIRYATWGARNFLTQAKRVFLFKWFLKQVDVVSFETARSFREVKLIPPEKKLPLPNGFDPDLAEFYGIRPRTFDAKENLILLVGRHGSREKNSELLLLALGLVEDLGDWQVYFVGPTTDGFMKEADRFFQTHPRHKGKVLFPGNISDKRLLFDYYNRAKLLCLPSRWESWGLVCVEAMYFGTVPIVSEGVASFPDLTDDGQAGFVLPGDAHASWADLLRRLIGDAAMLRGFSERAAAHFRKKFIWKDILENLDRRLKELQSVKEQG